MNDKKKLIELFVYIAIIIIGCILLITSGKKDTANKMMDMGGNTIVAVLDE